MPNGSLSVSHPAPQRSWPICLPRSFEHGLTGQDPARLIGMRVCAKCVCVRARTCASICYNREGLCDTSPLTPPLRERIWAREGGSGFTLQMWPRVTDVYTLMCLRRDLHSFVFISICLAWAPPPLLPHSPTPPTQSVCSLPDGVPGSPLTPCCTMTDGTAQPCQPSRRPLYCTVTGI